MQDISFTIHMFKEGDTYLAYVPELDVSSCGSTPEESRANIRDAVRGFLETCEEMGTLGEVLEESGYRLKDGKWQSPEHVSLDQLTLTFG